MNHSLIIKFCVLSSFLYFFFLPNVFCQVNQYTTNTSVRERPVTVAPLPFAEMRRVLEQKQAAYNQSVRNCINRVEEIYNSFGSYPVALPNNTYLVSVTNGQSICDEAKVFVYDGKITGFEWINMQNGARRVNFSSTVKNGKAIIKIILPDGTTSNYFDVYFIEAIAKLN